MRAAGRRWRSLLAPLLMVGPVLIALTCVTAQPARAQATPTAEISINPGHEQFQVVFNAKSVGFPSAVVSYEWKFGDGMTADTATPSVSHTYPKAGAFLASVTERDAKGNKATATGTLTLFACPQSGSCTEQVKNSGSVMLLRASGPIAATSPATVDLFVDPYKISHCEPQVSTAVAVTDAGFTGNLTITLDYTTSFVSQEKTTCFSSKVPFRDAAGATVTNGALPTCGSNATAPCVRSLAVSGTAVSKVLLIPPGDPKVGSP